MGGLALLYIVCFRFSINMLSSLLILIYSKTHLHAIKSHAHSMGHADLRKTGLFSASASIHVLRCTGQCAAVMEGLISASVFFKVMLVF